MACRLDDHRLRDHDDGFDINDQWYYWFEVSLGGGKKTSSLIMSSREQNRRRLELLHNGKFYTPSPFRQARHRQACRRVARHAPYEIGHHHKRDVEFFFDLTLLTGMLVGQRVSQSPRDRSLTTSNLHERLLPL